MLLSRFVYCAFNAVVWFVCCFVFLVVSVLFYISCCVCVVFCFIYFIVVWIRNVFSICVANSSFCFIVVVVGVIIDSYMLVYHFVSSVFVFVSNNSTARWLFRPLCKLLSPNMLPYRYCGILFCIVVVIDAVVAVVLVVAIVVIAGVLSLLLMMRMQMLMMLTTMPLILLCYVMLVVLCAAV